LTPRPPLFASLEQKRRPQPTKSLAAFQLEKPQIVVILNVFGEGAPAHELLIGEILEKEFAGANLRPSTG